MNRVLRTCAAALCVLAVMGCGKKDAASSPAGPPPLEMALSDMVAFDRAYIPVLALTDAGADAGTAMVILQGQWDRLHAKYAGAPGMNPQWKADFDNIDRMIATAGRRLREGKPPGETHDVLEGVRTLLMALRQGYGISYDLDLLTAYHAPMETIALTVKDKTPATLTAGDLIVLAEQVIIARKAWDRVDKVNFDPALFLLTPAQDQQLRAEIAREDAALDNLRSTLTLDDKANIIAAAAALAPHFNTIYTLFGDFATAQAPGK